MLVRKAADMALEDREKREKLKFHRHALSETGGIERLCSFLCHLENGDMEVARYLNEDADYKNQPELNHIFSSYLSSKIFERFNRGQFDLERSQEKRLNDRATIYFD